MSWAGDLLDSWAPDAESEEEKQQRLAQTQAAPSTPAPASVGGAFGSAAAIALPPGTGMAAGGAFGNAFAQPVFSPPAPETAAPGINASGGFGNGAYGPFNATQGADYVDAPTGTLRAQLEAQRQGDSQYGNAALALAVGLPVIASGPIAGPLGVIGSEAGNWVDRQIGAPEIPIVGGPFGLLGGAIGGGADLGALQRASTSALGSAPAVAARGALDNVVRGAFPEPQLYPGLHAGMNPDEAASYLRANLGMTDSQIQDALAQSFAPKTVDNVGPPSYWTTSQVPGPLAKPSPEVAPRGQPDFSPGSQGGPGDTTAFDNAVRVNENLTAEDQLRASLAARGVTFDETPFNPPLTSGGSPPPLVTTPEPFDGMPPRTLDDVTAELQQGYSSPAGQLPERTATSAGIGEGFTMRPLTPEEIKAGYVMYGPNDVAPGNTVAGQVIEGSFTGSSRTLDNVARDLRGGYSSPAGALPERTLTGTTDFPLSGDGFTMTPSRPGLSGTPDDIIRNVSNTMGRELAPEEMTWVGNRANLEKPPVTTPTRGLEAPAFSSEGQRVASVDRNLPPTPKQAFEDQQQELRDRISAEIQRIEAGNGRPMTPIEKVRVAQSERAAMQIPEEALKVGLADWLNVPRTLMTGLDFSYPLRQGLGLIRHQQEFWPALKAGWDSAFDSSKAEAVLLQIKNDPLAAQKKALDITLGKTDVMGREEAFAGMGAVGKIPLIGSTLEKLYGPSARANEVFINKFRSDVADTYINKINRFVERGHFNKAEGQAQIDQYMRTINYATMRGNLGPLEKQAGALGQAFFSLRSAVSRPQLVGQLIDKPFSPAWNEAVMDIAALIGMGATTLALADMAGAKVNMDPRSTDFGKIIVGSRHIDIWGGYQQIARTLYQGATGERVTSGGKVRDVTLGSFDRDDVLTSLLRNKLSPQAGAAVNTFFGDDFRKPPVDFSNGITSPQVNKGVVASMLAPLFAGDIIEAVKHDGLTGGLLGGLSFFGVGGMSYADTSNPRTQARTEVAAGPAVRAALPPNMADFLEGKNPNAFTPQEWRDVVAKATPEERAAIEKAEQALRDRKDIFQLNRDEQNARYTLAAENRAKLEPLAEQLHADWKAGRIPASEAIDKMKRLEAAADREAGATRNMGPKLSESNAYQGAVKGFTGEKTAEQKEVDLLRELEQKYYGVRDDPRVKNPDGTTNWDKVEVAQKALIDYARAKDPGFATRLEYNLQKDPANDFDFTKELAAIDRKLNAAGYYDQPQGTKTQFARAHPEVDALLSYRNGWPVHSQQAGNILLKLAPERTVTYAR